MDSLIVLSSNRPAIKAGNRPPPHLGVESQNPHSKMLIFLNITFFWSHYYWQIYLAKSTVDYPRNIKFCSSAGANRVMD